MMFGGEKSVVDFFPVLKKFANYAVVRSYCQKEHNSNNISFERSKLHSLSPSSPSPKVQTPMTDVAPGYSSDILRLNGVISAN